jgi:hypothetical protein
MYPTALLGRAAQPMPADVAWQLSLVAVAWLNSFVLTICAPFKH